ncbi:MAG: VWA domain-containing protein [Planctomycetota bacterium]
MTELFLVPKALLWMVAVPALWVLLAWRDRRRTRAVTRLCGPRERRLAAEVDPRRRRLSILLRTLACAALVLSFAQPIAGDDALRVDTRGADLVVCLDVSRSMYARDMDPDRLRAARREIRALTERAHEDRFALVVFAGEARVAVPLTTDVAAFLDFVERADPLSVQMGGTDLGAALDLAMRSLEHRGDRYGAILLLTDGEDPLDRGLVAAQRCAKAGLCVHCVGFGTERGSRITLDDGKGGERYLKDAAGQDVVSSLSPAGLRRIAEATGGSYVAAVERPLPLCDLYQRRILGAARSAHRDPNGDARANRFQIPLCIAVILLMLQASFSGAARSRPRAAHGATTARA